MAIIYKYTNLINGKSYIGQTTLPENRKSSHKSSSLNPNSKDYEKVFYRAIRKYGWENFSYEILEECDISELQERECYYMELFNSVENGYNIQLAGEGRQWTEERKIYLSQISQFKNSPLDYEDVVYIRQAYLDGKKPSEIYPEFKHIFTHYFSFLNVWTGSRYRYIMPEVFEIRPNRVKLDYEKAQEIRLLYSEGLSYAKIATIYGVGRATVRDVIKEHTWKTKEPVSTISG